MEDNSTFKSHRTRIIFFIIIIILLFKHFKNVFEDSKYNLCNIDTIHDLTETANSFIQDNHNIRSALMIISSLLIDVSVLSLGYNWYFYGKSWSTLLSIGIFYVLRGLCNLIYMMKSPDGLIWTFPGIASLTVSYHDTTDFFFSGHVGINLIAAIELKNFKVRYFTFISLIGILFQIITMIVLRGHYLVDIIAGLISAHYSRIISQKYSYYFDTFMNINEDVNFICKKLE